MWNVENATDGLHKEAKTFNAQKKMQESGCDKLIEIQTKQANCIRNSTNSILSNLRF